MIEVKDGLSAHEFVNDYVLKKRPVILNDVTKGWPALTKWSPTFLKEMYQDHIIQITSGRDADENLELNIHDHKSNISFSDYVDIVNSYEGNDVYLVANNHFFGTLEGAKLLGDFSRNSKYFSPGTPCNTNTRFWMGPKGTFTSLHRDEMDLFVVQVYGRKRIVMISPDQTSMMYNHVGVHSAVNYENPNLALHPLFDRTVRVEFTLHPGQAIFMPSTWWHFVKSLDASISLTMLETKWVPVSSPPLTPPPPLPATESAPPGPMVLAPGRHSAVKERYPASFTTTTSA